MNDKRKPTLEQLSFFYDGLLSEDDQKWVKEYLDSESSCHAMDLFQIMEASLEPDLSEDQIDLVLSNTIQEVHARIEEVRPRRESSWNFLFSPKLILGGAVAVLFLLCVATTVDWHKGSIPGQIAQVQQDENNLPSIDQLKERAQGEALLKMARMTKSALQSGVDYAARQTESSKGSFEGSKQTLVANALRTAMNPESPQASTNIPGTSESSAAVSLADVSKKQLAIGLGVSVLHLVSVF